MFVLEGEGTFWTRDQSTRESLKIAVGHEPSRGTTTCPYCKPAKANVLSYHPGAGPNFSKTSAQLCTA